MKPETVKSVGYLVSMISVLLLGAAGWSSAPEGGSVRLFLGLGMAMSIGGMLLRWLSYEQEHKANTARPGQQTRSRSAT